MLDFDYYEGVTGLNSLPKAMENIFGYIRASVPMYFEPGNFKIDGKGRCIVSNVIDKINSQERKNGASALTEAQMVQLLKDHAGCSQVTLIDGFPYEGTGHVNLFTKQARKPLDLPMG